MNGYSADIHITSNGKTCRYALTGWRARLFCTFCALIICGVGALLLLAAIPVFLIFATAGVLVVLIVAVLLLV